MKRGKLFVGISAFALTICAFVATKANKRFYSVSSGAFVFDTYGAVGSFSILTGGFTTTKSLSTHLVQLIKTFGISGIGTVLATLRTSSLPSSKKVFHN